MQGTMTWEDMRVAFPNQWLLIVDYDTDDSGHLLRGVVARHSHRKEDVYRLPAVETRSACKYTGQSTFPGGWRAHAQHHHV